MPHRPVAATDRNVRLAGEHLRAGRLVAFPTETVYGLGADARSHDAVRRVYEAKGRPASDPLIVHVGDIAAAAALGDLDAGVGHGRQLAEAFWPGPLTLVVPKRAEVPPIVSSLPSIGLRVPDHDGARGVIRATGGALAITSANRSDEANTLTVREAVAALGETLALALDGGRCFGGQPSTVARVPTDGAALQILRAGPLSEKELQAVLNRARQ